MTDVRLIVFDALGKEVAALVNEKLSPGSHETEFEGSNIPSGIYFYKIETGSFVETKRMMLLK
ncbi:MAG: T9SS type A sorting domain-containing protein [Ignavibacteria bacterium]|nr:T9SS type A sorting domain-containing protein [Ignavibacteria bacterium]